MKKGKVIKITEFLEIESDKKNSSNQRLKKSHVGKVSKLFLLGIWKKCVAIA